jgi:murein DD-endopeptidase MepM/ murein hydrolase activator NlpD
LETVAAGFRLGEDTQDLLTQAPRNADAYRAQLDALRDLGIDTSPAGSLYRDAESDNPLVLRKFRVIDRDAVFAAMREAQKRNPDHFKGLPEKRADYDTQIAQRFGARSRDQVTNQRGNVVAGLIGGVASGGTDPYNQMSMLAGAGEVGVIRFVLTEAIVGAGAEAALLPDAKRAYDRMGESFTASDMAKQVAIGAVGNVALAGAGKYAVAPAWKAAARTRPGQAVAGARDAVKEAALARILPYLPEKLRPTMTRFDDIPDDVLADGIESMIGKGNLAEHEQLSIAQLRRAGEVARINPFVADGAGLAAHHAKMDEAMRAILSDTARPPRGAPRETLQRGTALGAGRVAAPVGGDGFTNPVPGAEVSSGFGPRKKPKAGASTNHGGIDYAVPIGTPVQASAAGRVVFVGVDRRGGGNVVKIDHGGGIETVYAHLDGFDVKVGDAVQPGQRVARSGNSGNSTGPHLHFSVKRGGVRVNPSTIFGQKADGVPEINPGARMADDGAGDAALGAEQASIDARRRDADAALATPRAPVLDESGIPRIDSFADDLAPPVPRLRDDVQLAAVRSYVADGGAGSLRPEVIAARLGIDEEQARAGLIALSESRAVRLNKKGFYTRIPKSDGPEDMLSFIARRGGIRDDEGHGLGLTGLSAAERREMVPAAQRDALRRRESGRRDLKRFIPKAGPLLRSNGQSIDRIGEQLWEAGYFGKAERPSVDEVLEAIEGAVQSGVKRYVPGDEPEEAFDLNGLFQNDEHRIVTEQHLQAVAREYQIEVDDQMAELVMRRYMESGANDMDFALISAINAESEAARAAAYHEYGDEIGGGVEDQFIAALKEDGLRPDGLDAPEVGDGPAPLTRDPGSERANGDAIGSHARASDGALEAAVVASERQLLDGLDDPHSAQSRAVIDGALHDLEMLAELDPEASFLMKDGDDPVPLSSILADMKTQKAEIDAMRLCMLPKGAGQ